MEEYYKVLGVGEVNVLGVGEVNVLGVGEVLKVAYSFVRLSLLVLGCVSWRVSMEQ